MPLWTVRFLAQTLRLDAHDIHDVKRQIRDLEGIPASHLVAAHIDRRRFWTYIELRHSLPVREGVDVGRYQELAAVARCFFVGHKGQYVMKLDGNVFGCTELSMGEYVSIREFLYANNLEVNNFEGTDNAVEGHGALQEAVDASEPEPERSRSRSR